MIVVADASPINILIRINRIELLPRLYGKVLIPRAVHAELTALGTPEIVRRYISSPPTWLEVRSSSGPEETGANAGERDAIRLALDAKADLLLVDDLAARAMALRAKLPITGTLGILRSAHIEKLTNFATDIEALRATDFRVSEEVIKTVLRSL